MSTNNLDENVILGNIRLFILKIFVPFIKIMGALHAPYSEKHGASHFYEILKQLKPLDIILTETRGAVSNLFNRGDWKHAMIYVGLMGDRPCIIEAIGKGVVLKTLVEAISDKDDISVVRYKSTKKDILLIEGAKRWLHDQIGKPYDYTFQLGDTPHQMENFYCSELAYQALMRAFPGLTRKFKPKIIMGAATVEPDDFYKASAIFEIIFEVRSK